MNANGRGGFVDFLERAVLPCWPDIAPEFEYDSEGSEDSVGDRPIKKGPVIWLTDLGPGRLVADVKGLERRQALGDKGLIVYPSAVPNVTGAMQVMDQLYGELQAGMTTNAEAIVKERTIEASKVIKSNERAAADKKKTAKVPAVSLTNYDYARILNGRPSDPLKKRPFEWVFSPENVVRAWDDTGHVSKDGLVTMKCINHSKVRPGAALFEEDDGEFAGEAGSKAARVKEALVKHEAALEACRLATAEYRTAPPRNRIAVTVCLKPLAATANLLVTASALAGRRGAMRMPSLWCPSRARGSRRARPRSSPRSGLAPRWTTRTRTSSSGTASHPRLRFS